MRPVRKEGGREEELEVKRRVRRIGEESAWYGLIPSDLFLPILRGDRAKECGSDS